MSISLINQKEAEERAMKFLQQYHSAIKVKSAVLEDTVWLVEALVSADERKFRIIINAKTGRILAYQQNKVCTV
jgi:uncharacterized membrane protein YkoI